MGLRVNILLIGKKYTKPFTQLTIELGLGQSEITAYPLHDYFPFNPYHPHLCMGYYQDTTIITYNEFLNLFEEAPTPLEKQLCQLFNDCQMLLLTYRENEGDRGFLLFNQGERVRAKFVEEYEGTILDLGAKLEEEKTHRFTSVWHLLSKRIIGKKMNVWDIVKKKDEIDLDQVEMYKLTITSSNASAATL